MGKLIRKATGLTVGVATLLAGLVLPMTASAESASPIDASPIIHYSFDNALTSKTIANEGSAGQQRCHPIRRRHGGQWPDQPDRLANH